MNKKEQVLLSSFIQREEDEAKIIQRLQDLDPNTFIIRGSLINYASIYNKLDVVRFLIQNGADVNALFDKDYTPLMAAADNNNLELAGILLKAGADPHITDGYGNAALWKAVHKYDDDMSIVNLLLQNGGNPFQKNKKGKMPIDMAKLKETEDLIELFESLKEKEE